MTKMENLLDHSPKNRQFYTIAVDGRGGSGKTSLVNYLQNIIPGFVFLNFDDYFEPLEGKEVWGGFNKTRFINDVINPLKNGSDFIFRPYNWHKDPHIYERHIKIEKGLCLDGCFSFDFDLPWDLKIWVETPVDVCLKRGISRDGRNMGTERVSHAWKDIWLPPENEYVAKIQPLKAADIVLDGTKPFEEQIT